MPLFSRVSTAPSITSRLLTLSHALGILVTSRSDVGHHFPLCQFQSSERLIISCCFLPDEGFFLRGFCASSAPSQLSPNYEYTDRICCQTRRRGRGLACSCDKAK